MTRHNAWGARIALPFAWEGKPLVARSHRSAVRQGPGAPAVTRWRLATVDGAWMRPGFQSLDAVWAWCTAHAQYMGEGQ